MNFLRIGDLARLGGVSVRMLRHYHEIGLLIPDEVDDWTGYRSYGRDKLEAFRLIVTLKDLGIELAVIRQVMQEKRPSAYLRTVLIARREAIVAEVSDCRSMLVGVDRQLEFAAKPPLDNHSEQEPMTIIIVEVKPTEPRLVAQLSAVSESWAATDIGPVIQPLYPELIARMAKANVEAVGPSTASYEDTEESRLLECDPSREWVTEFQIAIEPARSS